MKQTQQKISVFVFLFLGILCLFLSLPLWVKAEPSPSPSPSPSPPGLSTEWPQEEITRNGDRGGRVFRAQQRLKDLGYLNYRPTGYYMGMTQAALRSFQRQNNLEADEAIGAASMEILFGNHPVRSAISLPNGKTSPRSPVDRKGVLLPWEEASLSIPTGSTVTLIDMDTGLSFSVQHTGGVRHADLFIPQAERAVYLSLFGGKPAETSRPVLLSYGGREYAASLSGRGHQGESSACLYLKGSTSNGLGIADALHDANVKKAGGE